MNHGPRPFASRTTDRGQGNQGWLGRFSFRIRNNILALTGNLKTDLAAPLLAIAPVSSTTAIQFAAGSAALVTLTGTGSDAGTYAVFNNHTTAGFLATADKVIKLPDGATVPSGSFAA